MLYICVCVCGIILSADHIHFQLTTGIQCEPFLCRLETYWGLSSPLNQ